MTDRRDYWDRLAEAGAEAAVIDPADCRGHKNRYIGDLRLSVIADALARHHPNAGRLLDLGCGSGQVSRHIAGERRHVVGADISPRLLALAREGGAGSNLSWVQIDGRRLPFAEGSFDVLFCWVVLNYVTDDDRFAAVLGMPGPCSKTGGCSC
jgi:2-polyprenyl-3-methyl-5-hydroxy-6-metoxy-1,4-benzoquinol methylase